MRRGRSRGNRDSATPCRRRTRRAQAAVASLQSNDGKGADLGDLPFGVEVSPHRHGSGRGADFRFPGPKLERRRNTQPRNSPLLRVGQHVDKTGQRRSNEIEDHLRGGVGEGAMGPTPDCPAKIDQHEIATAPADLEPERKGAVGIKRHRNRGLSDATAQRGLALQEAICLQSIHDRRSRLHR